MQLWQLHREFCVCKMADAAEVGQLSPYTFVSVTEDEVSLVCEASRVPAGATDVEPGWRGFRIGGVIDFSAVGVIARISAALSARGIPLFVVSTYNTDYVFTKADVYAAALAALEEEGYTL